MASNSAKGHGRKGGVAKRSQFFNPLTWLWQKRDDTSGKVLDVKTSGGKFKGVRSEKRKRKKRSK